MSFKKKKSVAWSNDQVAIDGSRNRIQIIAARLVEHGDRLIHAYTMHPQKAEEYIGRNFKGAYSFE